MGGHTFDIDYTGRKIREYELLRRIGVGGMGVVYEGHHPVIGKRVAVKFLLPALSHDRDLVERFKAEARSVNAIGHRGIVDIFDFGVLDDGTQYFVMELLEGRSFDRVIAAQAPLGPVTATRYLAEIVDALAAAHQAGVVHRDIKPSNVFLVETARSRPYIKLLDFGIAKTNASKTGTTPQTRQSIVVGTPAYIAPEQAQGRAIGPATDLYSVGCMAYEMLTGSIPFIGANPFDTMFKHVTEPVPRVSTTIAGTPSLLDDLIFQLMQKKPEERPASADEVLRRLEEASNEPHSEPGPVPSAPRPLVSAEALAPTFQSLKVSPPPPSAQVPTALPRRSLARPLALGAAVVAAAAVGAWLFSRESAEPVMVALPPARAVVIPAVVDAGPAAVDPPPQLVVAPPPAAVADAGVRAQPVAVKKGLTPAQLAARIVALEDKLERREAARGEVNPVLRSFLKKARADSSSARTEADRRKVWSFLDEVARQVER